MSLDQLPQEIVRKLGDDATSEAQVVIVSDQNDTLVEFDGSSDLIVYLKPGTRAHMAHRISDKFVHVFLDRDAHLTFASLQTGEGVVKTKRTFHVESGAEAWVYELHFGSKETFANTSVYLADNSRANVYSGFFGTDNQRFDLSSTVYHVGKNAYSNFVSKGILADKAYAKSSAMIDVGPNASGTDGYQDNQGLLLNEGIRVDFFPLLEIRNEDVKCSHGATVTNLDDNKLFYLMSRGVGKDEARQLMVEGFFLSLIDSIEIKKIREEVVSLLKEK